TFHTVTEAIIEYPVAINDIIKELDKILHVEIIITWRNIGTLEFDTLFIVGQAQQVFSRTRLNFFFFLLLPLLLFLLLQWNHGHGQQMHAEWNVVNSEHSRFLYHD